MSNDVSDLRDTIIPKSDQLNADQLVGGAMTITVTGIERGRSDADIIRGIGADQPLIIIHYEGENGRPFKPCKTVIKILIFGWGEDGRDWIGRRMTLFRDPEVKWAGVKVGGIRVSHMSHIAADFQVSLASTRGKKDPHIVRKLVDAPQQSAPDVDVAALKRSLETAAGQGTDPLKTAWSALSPAEKNRVGGAEYLDTLKSIAAQVEKNDAPEF